MTTSYVTVDQVIERMPSSWNTSNNAILTDVITSCSAFLDNYCRRANGGFAVQTYDEIYNGTGDRIMYLNNVPIQSIQRIATTQLPALSIHNTDPDMASIARVQLTSTESNPFNLSSQQTSTGMTLTYIANNVTTTNSLTWTSYPTVASLVAAINDLGSNWTAQSMSGMDTRQCVDLRPTQGAYGSRIVTSYFWIHWQELPWYRINENTGEIFSEMGFCRGWGNWRLVYSAGYSQFPDDLTQALCELVVATYMQRNLNPNLQSQSLGQYSYTAVAKRALDGLSFVSRKTIQSYRRHPIGHFSTY